MNPPRRWLLVAASVAALVAASPAIAQPYPSRPVTMIVPASAGGPTDAIARVLSERMTANLGGTVLVDNVAGAGGSIGVGKVARATPDGYTLGIGQWSHYVLNGATYALAVRPAGRLRADRPDRHRPAAAGQPQGPAGQ